MVIKPRGEEIPGTERQFFLILTGTALLLWIALGGEVWTGVYVDGGLNSHQDVYIARIRLVIIQGLECIKGFRVLG